MIAELLASGSVVSFTPDSGWVVRFTGAEAVAVEQIIGWAVVLQEQVDPEEPVATCLEAVLLVGSVPTTLSDYKDRHLADRWVGGTIIHREGQQA